MVGVYAGSFDPITRGHIGIICESILKLDKLVIGIGKNPSKAGWMPIEKREEIIRAAIEDFILEVNSSEKATPNEKEAVRRLEIGACEVVVESYEGMTVDFAIKFKAQQLMRGLRPMGDFETEQSLADANGRLAKARNYALSTVFAPTPDPRYIFASSSVVRALASEPIAIEEYLYPSTAAAVAEKMRLDGRTFV